MNSSDISSEKQKMARSYVAGFMASILLTLAAYILVERKLLSGDLLIWAIVLLAVVQMLAQLILFLHLGKEARPRWNLLLFLFMTLVLVMIVFGSLWIMYHLNYAMSGERANI